MASRSRRGALNREQTIVPAGIMTPDESFNTITLDDEHPNLKVESFSSYQTQRQHQERERRSESLSLRSSRPPQQMPRDMREATMAASTVPDFSSLGLNVVGKKVSVLVQAINDLRQVGVDGISKKLPELVLVGDQSAGKSSLMGALAEIHLPRRDGRCTLCPTNIKTSEANTWECKVFLEQEWRFVPFKQGQGITQRDVTKNNPFPQWTRQEMEVKPFKTITTKSELEGVLRWAQIALLNHNLDYKMFVPGSGARCEDPAKEEMASPAKFSPNTISVQISGPGLPALSFFDLPGIFQAAEDEKEQYLVKVFRNLARTYIERENALVICAVAMKTDPGNSSTSALITELRATDRCIGVLTMPDRLPSGRHEEYEKVLRGRAHVVGRGYFVTKQPSGDSRLSEPGYHKKAREEEAEYFETDPLWCGQWSEFRSRCGTGAIQEYLSQAFAEQIARSMPSIAQMISARTAQIDEQLAHLPELPAANVRVQIDVQRHLTSFSNDVIRLMNGESVSNSTENFHSLWGGLCNQFQAVIMHIKPMIKLFHESDKHPRRTMEVIEIIDDDDDADVTVTPSPSSRKRPAEASGVSDRGMKRQINDAGIPISLNSIPRHNGDVRRVSASPAPSSHSMGPPARQVKNPFMGSPFEPYANAGRGFIDLGGIRDTINRRTRPGVPNHNHPDVCNELCMKSVLSWKGPLEVFFGETVKVMHQELRHILVKHLGRYKETALFRQADSQLQNFLREFVDKQGKLVESLYNLETYKLYTINTATFTDHEQKELRGLREQRKLTRARFLMEYLEKTGKKRFTAQDPIQLQKDKKKAIEKISDEELGPDEFKNELDVAAYVRGYYLTAAQRFVDSICLSVHGNLFRDIHDNISYHLEEVLGIIGDGGEEICRALMEEDDGVARRRAELHTEKDKLTKFAARLNQLAEETGCGQSHENVNTQQTYHPPYLEEDMDDDYS